MEIVRGYYLGGEKQAHLAERFGTSQSTVGDILRSFAAENDKSALLMRRVPQDIQAEEIEALRKEVFELKEKLKAETMRADFYDTMIGVAEEMFDIEIRKKADTGQSKGCAEKSDTQ